jgi:hypothetical protein
MMDLADWYDCRKKWTYRTKHYGTEEIQGVWVNIFGATTPKLIESALPMDAIGGGLTSRMIFVYEEKKGKTVPDPFWSEDDLQLREDLLLDLDLIRMLQGPFRVSDDFVELWTLWYTEQDRKPPPFEDERFSGYFERRPTHIMKLSMILNASRTDSMTVTAADMNSALELLRLTERKMPMTFIGFGEGKYASILPKIMNEIGRRVETTYEDLMKVFWHDATKWDMDRMLEILESLGYCTLVTNTGIIRYNESYNGSYARKMITGAEGED